MKGYIGILLDVLAIKDSRAIVGKAG